MSTIKRKQPPSKGQAAVKKPRVEVPDYHLAPSVKEEDGSLQWPAPRSQLETARDIILTCAKANSRTLIVPDKDADGLSSGSILRHTLTLLGLSKEKISVHLLSKGNTVHTGEERSAMASLEPKYIFVLDHGSRSGPPIIAEEHVALVIDHHHASEEDFPRDSSHVTACHSPPVATTSLLTYLMCEPLHPEVQPMCDWLCVVGTHGDLGTTIKWEAPFPDMKQCLKNHTKKALNDAVAMVNAPRRTAARDVQSAWDALCDATGPQEILKDRRLLLARQEVGEEVERCTHAAPKFSPDGRIAVFRIRSEAQVHPIIATRWAGHLTSKHLEVVMVANEGYIQDKVNFSCRIPRCARNNDPPVDVIALLKEYANLPSPSGAGTEHDDVNQAPLLERLGEDFARGHVQASGGIVPSEAFEQLMINMQIGVKPPKKEGQVNNSPSKKKTSVIDSGQKNNLMSYFSKPTPKLEVQS